MAGSFSITPHLTTSHPSTTPVTYSPSNVTARSDVYNELQESVQFIMDRIYGSKEEFIEAIQPHPLEKYLIAFDTAMSNSRTIQVLASRIGIFIPY